MGPVDRLKTGFVAGLVLVAPLFVTIIAFQLLFGWSRGIINPIVATTGLGDVVGDVPYLAELLAMVLLVLVITLLGYVAQRSVGAYVFDLVDQGLARVPVFSVVYTGVRQVSNALTSQQSRFERVAMIEFPREGLYSLGFVTGESPRTVTEAVGNETYNVYVPGSPNPTQGRLLQVPSEEITELDMSVTRGLRLLVTTGIAEERSEMADLADEVGESSEAFETALEELDDGDQR